ADMLALDAETPKPPTYLFRYQIVKEHEDKKKPVRPTPGAPPDRSSVRIGFRVRYRPVSRRVSAGLRFGEAVSRVWR
ncbi:MAG: hypothetical protein Q8O82_15285, partial [Pseudorhodobacter sp.]|nr:hypothetical protein [Pseudorhodobacter sp.]